MHAVSWLSQATEADKRAKRMQRLGRITEAAQAAEAAGDLAKLAAVAAAELKRCANFPSSFASFFAACCPRFLTMPSYALVCTHEALAGGRHFYVHHRTTAGCIPELLNHW